MEDSVTETEFEKQNRQTTDHFKIGMQVQVNLLGRTFKWGNDRDDNEVGTVECIDVRHPSIFVRITKHHCAWFKATELKILSQEPQQTQPKTQQSTQEFTFTLDDLAKACDTSGIGSQKFLELQRALTNLK